MGLVWLINLLLIFLLCAFFVGIVIPQIMAVALRRKLFDMPDERKAHHIMTPRLGGTAFMPVVFLSFFILLTFNAFLEQRDIYNEMSAELLSLAYTSFAVILAYLVGFIDDLKGVSYKVKLLVQALCGLLLVMGGVLMTDLHGLVSLHHLPQWSSILLTIFAVLFITNSVNLIDGIDGLASGLCIIAFLCYGITFIMAHQYLYAMLSFAMVGVLVPFFYYNVFGKAEEGNKIFMGDTGSLTLGLMLCFLGIQLSHIPDAGDLKGNTFVIAFSPLLIPCLDVVRVFSFRVRKRMNPFMPGKHHIHHRLMALGLSQRKAMGILVASSALLVLLNVVLSCFVGVTLLLMVDVLLWIVANMAIAKFK